MCLIVCSKHDKPISKALLENMHNKNNDGWGLMWIENNVLQVKKDPQDNFTKLWDAYQAHKDKDPVIHLRWKTHGEQDLENTHPFYCGHGIWLMHNGVVNAKIKDEKRSDTWHFAEHYIKPLFERAANPHDMIRNAEWRYQLGKMIGTGNRMLFMDRGGYVLINPNQWYEVRNEDTGIKGITVSNEYAWDATTFGKKPRRPTDMYSYGGATTSFRRPTVTEVPSIATASSGDPHILMSSEGEMTHLIGNIYEDMHGQRWYLSNGKFNRAQQIDNVNIAGSQNQALTRKPTPETTFAKELYGDILVRTYQNASDISLANLVSTEPDEAVHLIKLLFKGFQMPTNQ